MFLLGGYDAVIFCFSKRLSVSSAVPVTTILLVPGKEARNRPTLSIR
jgi:hypothetical protein